jgi:hypothetical protein
MAPLELTVAAVVAAIIAAEVWFLVAVGGCRTRAGNQT